MSAHTAAAMGNVSATCPGSARKKDQQQIRLPHRLSAARSMRLRGLSIARVRGRDNGASDRRTDSHAPVHTKRRTEWSSFSSLVFLFWTRRSPKGELSQRGKKSPSGGSSLFQKRENVGGSLRGPAVSAWPSPSGTASSALPAPAWKEAEPPATSPPARPAAAAAASHSPGTGRTPQSTAE